MWVDIDSGLFDPAFGHRLYNEFIDELEYAASVGFDAICVNEHHSKLCVLGNSIALYDPPTRVAEEMAMIDVISRGRLIAGFPVGSSQDTCFAYGKNPS